MVVFTKDFITKVSQSGLVFNLISLFYGIFYAVSPGIAPWPVLFGIVMLVTLTLNAFLVYLNSTSGANKGVKNLGTFYLLFSIAAFTAMPWGGFASSSAYAPTTSYLLLLLFVYPAFFGTLFIGFLHCRSTLNGLANAKAFGYRNMGKTKKYRILTVFLTILLLSGILFAYILVTDYLGLLQILVSQNAVFLAFFYLSLALLLLKAVPESRRFFRFLAGTAGILLFAIFMLPLLMMPGAITKGDAAFAEAFNEQYDPSYESHFRRSQFSLPAYFLGIPPGNYHYEQDQLFYQGVEGVDRGIELYYDVFLPPEGATGLPGEGSTIIRIHGGAWIAGDKGMANMMQMNQYFAAQGYTVFDIQYGLSNLVSLPGILQSFDFLSFAVRGNSEAFNSLPNAAAPSHLVGPFTLDDMMRHIGIFTRYLQEHAPAYGASLDSVFITGGSAGGHLTTALALALTNGEHEDLFGSGITVKGYIPFYPANKATPILETLGGAPEWVDVELLVREDSPPVLIYQGTSDGMVPQETAFSFRERYLEKENQECAVILLPLAAHASDLQFSGYYNQVFLYYMERFMAAYK